MIDEEDWVREQRQAQLMTGQMGTPPMQGDEVGNWAWQRSLQMNAELRRN